MKDRVNKAYIEAGTMDPLNNPPTPSADIPYGPGQ